MESVKDVLHSFKERLTNPFLGAFIISWLIFNYDIIITLLVYDEKIWHTYGHDTVLDFIKSRLCIEKSLWYPLASALGYVLMFPVLKNLVNIYMAFSGKWGSKSVFSVSKEGAVSMERYFRMKSIVKEQIQKLKEAVKEESEYLTQIGELELKKAQLETNLGKSELKASELEAANTMMKTEQERLNKTNEELTGFLKKYNDNIAEIAEKLGTLDGIWRVTWEKDKETFLVTLKFESGRLLIKDGPGWNQIGIIRAYDTTYDGQLIFVRELVHVPSQLNKLPNYDRYTVVVLTKRFKTLYAGTENNSVEVIYEKTNIST